MSEVLKPIEPNNPVSNAIGQMAFLLSVIRCGENLSDVEESYVRDVINNLRLFESQLAEAKAEIEKLTIRHEDLKSFCDALDQCKREHPDGYTIVDFQSVWMIEPKPCSKCKYYRYLRHVRIKGRKSLQLGECRQDPTWTKEKFGDDTCDHWQEAEKLRF